MRLLTFISASGAHLRRWPFRVAACFTFLAVAAFSQSPGPAASPPATAAVHGTVRNAQGQPLVDVRVFLDHQRDVPGAAGTTTHTTEGQSARTNGKGAYGFSALVPGDYALHAEADGQRTSTLSLSLAAGDAKTADLRFSPPEARSDSAQVPEFFDEPKFTVAGVAPATNSGAHGSDAQVRASQALVKATDALSAGPNAPSGSPGASHLNSATEAERTALRAKIAAADKLSGVSARPQQAGLHHQLAQLDEALGDPLEAVREYERAAELDPREPNLFDWATELLNHGAQEQAADIFDRGSRLHPKSVRMLLGLGVAWYARGEEERAAHFLALASDISPTDATPYLFMGRIVTAQTTPSQETVERLGRYADLAPTDAMANYYGALALWKRAQAASAFDDSTNAQVEALLEHSIQLDPKLGAAHLQLGILYTQRGEEAKATAAYEKAVAATPDLAGARYRLSLAYRRAGRDEDAHREMQVYEQLTRNEKETAARERGEMQQFVISLRDEKGR